MNELSTPVITGRIAMLIDGDNAQPSLIGEMIAEAGKYGLVTIRRIYGDWTTTNMTGWKDILNEHAVQPIQQFRYTIGKNATDSALIIDAMDILYTQNLKRCNLKYQLLQVLKLQNNKEVQQNPAEHNRCDCKRHHGH